MTTPNVPDSEILNVQRNVINGIVARLNALRKSGPVPVAIEMMAGRIVASGNSLAVLSECANHDWSFDAASVLRTIYDVMLQALWIMVSPSEREERARLCLDFIHVERKRRIDLMDGSETDLAKRFSASPKRAGAEPEIKKQFDAVKAAYLTKRRKVRRDWYPGSLRDLAREVRLEEEYVLMQKFLSEVVHSSPLAMKEGPLIRGYRLMDSHWIFAARVLGAYAECMGVALAAEEQGLVDLAPQNVFNLS